MTARFAVDDVVNVLPVRGSRAAPRRGVVTRVGRTLVDVNTSRARWASTITCFIDTGWERGDFPSWRVVTDEQLAEETRQDAAVARIRSARVGVDVTSSCRLSADALETIAALCERGRS